MIGLIRDALPLLFQIVGRRRLALAVVGSVLVAVLELVGVGLVLPLIIAVADPSAASALPAVLQDLVPDAFDRDAASALAVAVVVVFAARAAITLSFRWWLFGLSSRGEADLASALMHAYLRAPLEFHRSRSSSDLIRVLLLSSDHFFVRVTLPLLTLLTEGLIVVLLVSALLVFEPGITLVAVAYFGLSGAVFTRLTARRMHALGRRYQAEHADAMRAAQEAFGGVIDVVVRRVADPFTARFASVKLRTANTKQRQQFISELPRNYLESAFLIGIGLLVLFVLATSDSQSAATASLALVAAVGFRLMPSLVKIVTALNAVRSGAGALELVVEDLRQLGVDQHDFTVVRQGRLPDHRSPPGGRPPAPPIDVRDVAFRYPGSNTPVVDGVTLSVPAGAWLGIAGPSGAGKSTLLLMVLGLLQPSSGEICVRGRSISDDVAAWHDLIGYVPQGIYLLDDTLAENIRFGLRAVDDEERLREALEGAALDEFVGSLRDGLETRVAEGGSRLSGGQRQRIGIARALYRRPSVLVLDEATSALDPATESSVLDTLDALRGQMSIISVAHGASAVARCDEVVELADGRVRARSSEGGSTTR